MLPLAFMNKPRIRRFRPVCRLRGNDPATTIWETDQPLGEVSIANSTEFTCKGRQARPALVFLRGVGRNTAEEVISPGRRNSHPEGGVSSLAKSRRHALTWGCGCKDSNFCSAPTICLRTRHSCLVRCARCSGPDPTRKENQRRPDQARAPKHPEAIEKAEK